MILDLIAQAEKVLILGYAREGQSTHRFLKTKFPKLVIDIADQKDNPNYLNNLKSYQVIIKSPGISPHKPEIEDANKSGVIFTSHTQIFFDLCPGKIIGITGTKGKSTTTSLIYEVLKANDLDTLLVGNIGKPALDYLDQIKTDTWVVMELSSYQLMDLTKSPHIAILLDIYPDHLDYHLSFEEYRNAKLNITKYQTSQDFIISQTDYPSQAQKFLYSLADFNPQISTQLIGNHNKLNIIPSIIISRILKLSSSKTYSAIADFKPLETRLDLVITKNNIRFYADTLATIPEATIAAIDAFSSDLHTLIAGGHDRGQDYSNLCQKILSSAINTVILFPATGLRIQQELAKFPHNRKLEIYHANTMLDAVQYAFKHTPSGKICLLSPAAPSFTLFKNYQDEYEQYKQTISQFTSTSTN